eukprot:TRINITY_DN3799_c0_g1_i1.p1 TRINITY_DN3799_c0_g1~~TRINITY_DN3799_c0_g1_i1.p1  ORF type:complete len:202 (+),score=25.11 TRINITY_DN3799_c0_g1_i1:690-1295(+)
MVNDAKVQLAEVINKPKQILHFDYNLGMHFTHVVTLMDILPPELSNGRVECLDGQLACIPDGFGGGFAEDYPSFLDEYRAGNRSNIVRSGFDSAAESSNTADGRWEPLRFDKNEVNARLSKALAGVASVGPSPVAVTIKKEATPTSTSNGSTTTDQVDLRCDYCGSTKDLKLCGVCKQVRYCSVECQRKGWATHKAVCKKR